MEILLKNGKIDTSVQKVGVPGVPGCVELTGDPIDSRGKGGQTRFGNTLAGSNECI